MKTELKLTINSDELEKSIYEILLTKDIKINFGKFELESIEMSERGQTHCVYLVEV